MIATCLDAQSESAVLTCAPCGKINLTLEVGARRADGFHEVQTLAVGVGVRDLLTFRRAAGAGVRVTCGDLHLAQGDNLIERALERLAQRGGMSPPGLGVELEKKIPVAAGLGGGSSDAAAALRLANRMWNLGLSDGELASIGAEVGSDVPLFFSLPAAMASGRGEVVKRVAMTWRGWALLVCVDVAVSTAEAYAALDALREAENGRTDGAESCCATTSSATTRILTARRVGDFESLLFNDLEPAVFRVAPAVGEVHRTLTAAGLGPLRVSGAGSVLVRLFDDRNGAEETARRIGLLDLGVRCLTAAVPTVHGLSD